MLLEDVCCMITTRKWTYHQKIKMVYNYFLYQHLFSQYKKREMNL